MEILFLTLVVISAGCIGFAIGGIAFQKRWISENCIGVLREDHSDPEEAPYLFLELQKDGFEKIRSQKYVVLEVLRENYIPRK